MAHAHRLASRRHRLALAGIVVALTSQVSTASAWSSGASPGPGPRAVDVRAAQWWLDILSVEKVWEGHTRGRGVVVAVIDGGVEPVGDLEGAVLPGFTASGAGRGDTDDDPAFHGTDMATKIAGRGTGPGIVGMAPEAKILPVKIPTVNQDDHTAEALRTLAAMDDPPEVVNMSYNGGGECTPDELAAVREAVDAGMILVASAGNNGGGPVLPTKPASCPGVVTVGAYGFYGNVGDRPDIRIIPESEARPYVALAAPGERLISFPPGSSEPVYYKGTSGAAAITSGVFALVRAAYPEMPSREVVARVLATAHPLDGSPGRSASWGFGAARPLHAIEEDVPATAPNPLYDELDAAVPPSETSLPAAPETSGGSESSGGSGDAEPRSDASDDAVGEGVPTGLILGVVGALALLAVLGGAVAVMATRRRRTG